VNLTSTSRLIVRPVESDREWEIARQIRTTVFIIEQECPPEEEWDEYDDVSRHLLAWLESAAIGVARWRTSTHNKRVVAKLERFAILPPHRGQAYGRELIRQTIEDARRAGFTEQVVHAQAYLEDLYRSFGFVTEGETFMEAGIPHVKMVHAALSDS
jgi:predicted GNAT family N-acyltransferase